MSARYALNRGFSGLGIRGAEQRVAAIADLRAIAIPLLAVGETAGVRVTGYYAKGDGGGGSFVWDAASVATDDGGAVINPNGNAGAGRWLAQFDGDIDVKRFGARGDGVTNDTVALSKALATGKSITGGNRLHVIVSELAVTTARQCIRNLGLVAGAGYASTGGNNALLKVTAADVVIDGCYFDCNGIADGAQTFPIASGVVARGAINAAVYGSGAHRIEVTRCYFTRAWRLNGSAIGLIGVDLNKNAIISGNTFEYNYGGACFTQSEGMIFAGNLVLYANDAGVAYNTGGGKQGAVTGNRFVNCELGGVAIESGAEDIAITGNFFYNNLTAAGNCSVLVTTFALGSALCSRVLITANTFLNVSPVGVGAFAVGVRVTDGSDVHISGNVFKDVGDSRSIYITGDTGSINNLVIEGNQKSGDSGSVFLEWFSGHATTKVEALVIQDNVSNGGSIFAWLRPTAAAAPTKKALIIGNIANASGTEPVAINGLESGMVGEISGNRLDAITQYGGVGVGAILNTYGTKYAEQQGYIGQASPTAGAWKAGSVVKHSAPAVGQPKGWVCTVAGSPGTWVSEGVL